MVTKIPMNSFATSAMGAHSKSFFSRRARGVVASDRMAARPMSPICKK